MRELHLRFWTWVFDTIHTYTCTCGAYDGLDDDEQD